MSLPSEYIKQILSKNLEHRKNQGLLRTLFRAENCIADFSQFKDFCSNDYLGLARQLASVAGVATGSGASRIVMQRDTALDELESRCAGLFGWPTGVFLPHGFMANLALFDVLASLGIKAGEVKSDESSEVEVFLDHRAHASLHLGKKMSGVCAQLFRHHDYNHLEKLLQNSRAPIKIIVVESLHSMDGTFECASTLASLCEKNNAVIVVDEAHTAGICGAKGSGWIQENSVLLPHVLCAMYGFGKGMGVSGGFIGCSQEFRSQLMQCGKSFLYSTAQSPVLTQLALQAVTKIESENSDVLRENLHSNILMFRNLFQKMNWSVGREYLSGNIMNDLNSPIFSVALDDSVRAVKWEQALLEKKFMVRAIRPPTVPRNTARLRIILHSYSSESDMQLLVEELSGLRGQNL